MSCSAYLNTQHVYMFFFVITMQASIVSCEIIMELIG